MSHLQIEKELNLLNQYNKALQFENKSRNQERLLLEKEVYRLNQIVRELENKGIEKNICNNCDNYRSENRKLQDRCQRLQRDKNNLQLNYDALSKQLSSRSTVTSSIISTTEETKWRSEKQEIQKKYFTAKSSQQQFKRLAQSREQTINNLETKLSEINLQLYQLKQKHETQISELKRSKIVTSTTISSSEIESYKRQSNTWKYKYEQINRKYESLAYTEKQSKITAEKTIQNLQSKLSEINGKLYEYQNSIKRYELEVVELKRHPEPRIVTSTTISKSQAQNWKRQVNNWKIQYEDLNRKYELLVSDSKSEDRVTLQYKISELERQKIITSNEISTLKRDIEYKNEQISRLKKISLPPMPSKQLQSFKSQNLQLKQKYQKANLEINELKRKEASINNQLITVIREKESKQSEIRMLSSYQSEIRMLKEQIKTKDTYIQELRSKTNSQYDELLGQKEEIITELESKVAFLQRKASENLHFRPPSSQEEQHLKNQLSRLSSINISISNQLFSIKKQNIVYVQRLRDFQRRIILLQQTNKNLQNQLRISIEDKSRIYTEKSELSELREIIKELRIQLKQTKQYNDIIKKQNQLMWSKITDNEPRKKFAPPAEYQNKQSYDKGFYHQGQVNEYLESKKKKSQQRYHVNKISKKLNTSSLNEHKWRSLQNKIAFIKSQNQGLKKTLNNMSDY